MNDETTPNREDSKDDLSSEAVWINLVRWVQDGKGTDDGSSSSTGGYVHPSLSLRGNGPSRGIKATAPIAKGELLIRLGSRHVLSGSTETETTDDDETATTVTTTTTASPWLKCVGAFLKAKRKQQKAGNDNSSGHGPYLNSLPSMKDYETLHKWSTQDEVEPFLKGTTLGNLVALDRTTKGIQTRYRDSVEPYLQKVGAIVGTVTERETSDDNEVMETNADYQSFLEASMCISTRGFHLLPATDPKETETTTTTTGTTDNKNNNNSYDGPFLLPVIDLLNHDPKNTCTTLRRHQGTGNNGGDDDGCFVMVAEREIAKGEEIFHSYGSDMTSAQLLQTFGFVSRKHSSDAVAAAASDPPKVSQSATPVGLRAKDHLIAAARSLKASTFPDTVMDRIRTQKGQSTVRDDEEDEGDYFWEVCDIPDRPNMAFDDEFLVSASQARDTNGGFLLTEDTITLMAAQFLPGDAFDIIFPSGDDASNTVRLDRSILIDDYYLGMLVYKSLLVALFLKARDYCGDTDANGEENKNAKEESADSIAKAISGAAPAGSVGRYLSSLLKNETARIRELLEKANAKGTTTMVRVRTEREIYGRTIRNEELTNLWTFCKEIEDLMATLSLGGGGENESDGEKPKAAPQHDRNVEDDSPHKRARVE
jgi:hypothetical protein